MLSALTCNNTPLKTRKQCNVYDADTQHVGSAASIRTTRSSLASPMGSQATEIIGTPLMSPPTPSMFSPSSKYRFGKWRNGYRCIFISLSCSRKYIALITHKGIFLYKRQVTSEALDVKNAHNEKQEERIRFLQEAE